MSPAAALSAAFLAALLASEAPPGAAPEPRADPLPRLTPLESRALDKVMAALPQRTVPVLSGPLVQAARALARSAASGEPRPLSAAALRSALGEAGVSDPAPAAVVLSAAPSSLPEALAAAARFRGATHLGVGVALEGGVAWAVLLASERRAELEPFPRRVAPGSVARLSGRLVRLELPRVWVAYPAGSVRELPVEVEGVRFTASVHFGGTGTYRVEVGGEGPRGPTVAALLDVACGEEGPAAPRERLPEPSDPGEALARIRDEANALRARQALRPLHASPSLDEIALKHSRAMLAAATLAHRLDGGDDLAGRLAAAGVPYRSARENVARGDGALDAHRATVESPAHLANLLDAGATLLGVGIARGALPGGQPVVYLTEILLEPRGPFPDGGPPTGAR